MPTIHFDKREYKAGETATITYVDAPVNGFIFVMDPTGVPVFRGGVRLGGLGSCVYTISTSAVLGEYTVELVKDGVRVAFDTMKVVSGAAPPPTEPPPTGFVDTGKVTPSTIEVDPATYDVMFKLTGYKDKIILNAVVLEGATKTVSATLESEVTPPTKGYLTVNTSPTGATVTVDIAFPCGTTPVTKCELDTGTKTVKITKSGYNTVTRSVTITAGATTDLGTITLTLTGVPPTGITKSEFIAEIQSRGVIDLSKVSISRVLNNWFKVVDSIRFEDQGYIIIIMHIDLRNPPSRVEDIIFYNNNYSALTSIDRAKGLAIINKLPFGGEAPPTKKTVTFMSVPSGASLNITSI